MIPCKISDYGCAYHACMSDHCQMREVHANGTDWGTGKCGKMREPKFRFEFAEERTRCSLCGSVIKPCDILYIDSDTGKKYCTCRVPLNIEIRRVNGITGVIKRVNL